MTCSNQSVLSIALNAQRGKQSCTARKDDERSQNFEKGTPRKRESERRASRKQRASSLLLLLLSHAPRERGRAMREVKILRREGSLARCKGRRCPAGLFLPRERERPLRCCCCGCCSPRKQRASSLLLLLRAVAEGGAWGKGGEREKRSQTLTYSIRPLRIRLSLKSIFPFLPFPHPPPAAAAAERAAERTLSAYARPVSHSISLEELEGGPLVKILTSLIARPLSRGRCMTAFPRCAFNVCTAAAQAQQKS
jgi:hypothetical protein